MNPELRFTDTNAGTDSGGRTWGMEGNLVWWLIAGMGSGIAVFFILITMLKAGLLSSVFLALIPVVLVLLYILMFRQGKPPGYDRDLAELATLGRGFGDEPAPGDGMPWDDGEPIVESPKAPR
jgi:Flp pilus assembly protein TadB